MAKKGSAQAFRFYDNRQKYLAFVNTCNEKSAVSRRAALELQQLRPRPPSLNLFDAGMGDGTVLSRILRYAHSLHPTVPVVAVAKEISLEDVRLGLDKMPERFSEHPATVLVITNLNYTDAPRLTLRDPQQAATINWQEVKLKGDSAHAYGEQIEEMSATLASGWQTHPSEKTGNPIYQRPSILVIYREDHQFLLDGIIPQPGRLPQHYDLILASQPWRARMSAQFKASKSAGAVDARVGAGRTAAGHPVGGPGSGTGDHPEAVARRRIRSRWIAMNCWRHCAPSWAMRRAISSSKQSPTTRRCFTTRCARCRRRSPTASARRRCLPRGMRPST